MMTTSGPPVSATFLPACFLKAIPRPVVLLVRRLRLRRAALRLVAAEHLGVARDEPVGRIVTAKAQQVHANRRLDERREVAPRTDGQDEVRHGDAEYLDRARFEAQSVNLARLLPALKPYVESDLFGPAHCGYSEQLAYVENAEAAYLHVLAQEVGRAPRQLSGARPPDFDEVVGHELVAAHDEVKRALGLPHPRLASDEDAQAVEVEQNAVARLTRRESFLQVLRDLRDGDGADERRLHERERRALGGLDEFGGRREPFRDKDAGDFLELKARDCFAPLLRRELAEVLQFALADYLHAPLVQVVREARERESELLYARRTEVARLRAARACDEAEPQARGRVGDERADRDGRTLTGGFRRMIHLRIYPRTHTKRHEEKHTKNVRASVVSFSVSSWIIFSAAG